MEDGRNSFKSSKIFKFPQQWMSVIMIIFSTVWSGWTQNFRSHPARDLHAFWSSHISLGRGWIHKFKWVGRRNDSWNIYCFIKYYSRLSCSGIIFCCCCKRLMFVRRADLYCAGSCILRAKWDYSSFSWVKGNNSSSWNVPKTKWNWSGSLNLGAKWATI